MRRADVATFLFAASVFFFSLNAFSVRATFAAYVCISLLVFVAAPTLMKRQSGVQAALIYWFLAVCITFILSAFGDFYTNFFIKFLLIQTYIALVFLLFSSRILTKLSLQRACEVLIYIHAAFFLFQLFYYLGTGTFIDFDSYIREADSEALYATKALSDSLISIRALGLYSEPSFYSMTVVPAGIILMLAKRRLTVTSIVAFATALLSFSIAAIIVCAILCATHLLIGRGSIRVKVLLIAAALSCVPSMYDIYDKRVNQSIDYDAAGSRTAILTELKTRDIISDVVGSGLFWDERNNVGRTHLRGYQVRDSSFYIYILFGAGYLGATIFFGALLMLFRKRGQRQYLCYLLPVLLFKFHALYGMLWITLLFFVILGHQTSPHVFPVSHRRRATPTFRSGVPLSS